MSRVARIGNYTSPAGLSIKPPGTPRHAVFPGICEATPTLDGVPFSKYPVRISNDAMDEAWDRVRTFRAVYTLETPDGTFNMPFTMPYIGLPTPLSESSRKDLTYTVWQGGAEISPPPNLVSGSFTLEILRMEGDDLLQTAYYWRYNTDPHTIIPRFRIRSEWTFDGPTEYSITASTDEEPPPLDRTAFYFTSTLSFMGISVPFWCNPGALVPVFTISIEPELWWAYARDDSSEPIYNTATGAQILNNVPIRGGNRPL